MIFSLMHSLFTALVFTVALWLTDANLANTTAFIAGRSLRGAANPARLGVLMALAWGLFYWLTH